jgi:hypothetical protein
MAYFIGDLSRRAACARGAITHTRTHHMRRSRLDSRRYYVESRRALATRDATRGVFALGSGELGRLSGKRTCPGGNAGSGADLDHRADRLRASSREKRPAARRVR